MLVTGVGIIHITLLALLASPSLHFLRFYRVHLYGRKRSLISVVVRNWESLRGRYNSANGCRLGVGAAPGQNVCTDNSSPRERWSTVRCSRPSRSAHPPTEPHQIHCAMAGLPPLLCPLPTTAVMHTRHTHPCWLTASRRTMYAPIYTMICALPAAAAEVELYGEGCPCVRSFHGDTLAEVTVEVAGPAVWQQCCWRQGGAPFCGCTSPCILRGHREIREDGNQDGFCRLSGCDDALQCNSRHT